MEKQLGGSLIVWNIGQGQWITKIEKDTCIHYDIGGEIFLYKKTLRRVLSLCDLKINQINISHWDYDHYSYLQSFVKQIPQNRICMNFYQKQFLPAKIDSHLNLIMRCQSNKDTALIYGGKKNLKKSLQKNQSSLVLYDNQLQVLVPGDSPKSEEKKWRADFSNARILILGHHGSKTSTSKWLLDKIGNLKMAVSSARFIRYKHPSRETVDLLKKRKTPLLRTEQWGNLIFY